MKIITDKALLSRPCIECDIDDPGFQEALEALLSTAGDIRDRCAGLAFNQIGYLLRGFVIKMDIFFDPIINPEYISKSVTIKSRLESCLSRPGQEPIKKRRHVKIRIKYYDMAEKKEVVKTFYQLEARIIQHEMDHLNGVLI